MIRAFFSSLLYGGAILLALYLVTGVDLGQHTLAEHVVRIFQTDEAQELKDEMKATGERVEHRVRHEVGTFARRDRAQ